MAYNFLRELVFNDTGVLAAPHGQLEFILLIVNVY